MEIQDLKPILTSLIPQIEMRIKDIKYVGDESDLGNEIGYTIGKVINFTEEDTESFIHGIRHGISLTNGTH